MTRIRRTRRLGLRALLTAVLVATGTLVVAAPAQAAFVPRSDTTYKIELVGSSLSYQKCLNVEGANTANYTEVQMWQCDLGWNAQWSFEPYGVIYGRQTYRIKSRQSGKCLDVRDGVHYQSRMQIWSCGSGWNQRFVFDVSPHTDPAIVKLGAVYTYDNNPSYPPLCVTALSSLDLDIGVRNGDRTVASECNQDASVSAWLQSFWIHPAA